MMKHYFNIQGLQINYYFICKRKLWLYSHHIEMESQSDVINIGKFLHETSYMRDDEIQIDNTISIDFIRKKEDSYEIHEVKKSDKMEEAHKYQLLYYMYYLKEQKNFKNLIGIINYPSIRKTEKIFLTSENERKLLEIINDINHIIKSSLLQPKKTKKCYKCAYYDFCFI